MAMSNPRIVLPIVTLVVGFVAGGGMIATRRAPLTERPERELPLVHVQRAQLESVRLSVRTRGTVVRAPSPGRARDEYVGRGQLAGRGAAIARLDPADYAEVRLPIPDAEAAYVDLPTAQHDVARDGGDEAMPELILRARLAGRGYEWRGRIVRTEPAPDPLTGTIHAVARVEDPYGRGDAPDRPPLAVGLSVEAEIPGRRVDDVAVLPRRALRGHARVAIVDRDGLLRLRAVEVLERNPDTVLVSRGVLDGDRICTSPLPISVDAMAVRVVEADALASDERGSLRRDGEGVFVAGETARGAL